jgi:hypothetical protein
MAGILDKIKGIGKRFRKDELEGFTKEEKERLNTVIKERKLELIARSRLRRLEEKLEPKPKKKMKEVFEEIKTFRHANLRRREEQLKRTEARKKRFKEIESKRRGRDLTPKTGSRKPFQPTRLKRI